MANATNDGDRLIGLREAGERVGLSYWTIQRRVRSGALPAYRTGPNTSPLRLKVSDVDALLQPVAPQRD
ncbi:DNA-binding protein [Mycolicibacterium mucogenicum]|uniref:DNA-binding protein n=1 Tax=Mycolicibacterium mucogenicum TaxID=56689 RepID=A0A1A3HDP0_MYCMU|nr:DNA-binding protein [Mycolicibacterium mucogenicum]OBJ46170.1 DNA-binding protein [Mycolicibacterium mucogenicum]